MSIDQFTQLLNLKWVDDLNSDSWPQGKDLFQSPLAVIPAEFCNSRGTPSDYGKFNFQGHRVYHSSSYTAPRNQDFYAYFPKAEEDEEWQAECLRDHLNNPEPEEWADLVEPADR